MDSNRRSPCPCSKLLADVLFHQTFSVFVLLVRPRASESGWLDFIVDNSSQEILYSAHKVRFLFLFVDPEDPSLNFCILLVQNPSSSIYTIYDPLTSTSYGTLFHPPPSLPNATTPNPKLRTISLEHPKMETILRNSGGLSWQWEFEWEETKYVWGRDVVGLLGSERGYTLSVVRSLSFRSLLPSSADRE